MLDALSLPFVQRGLIEVLLLAVAGGLLGTWIVLRGLAFYSHALGAAAFPGLVLADGLGFAAILGAGGTVAAFAAALAVAGRRAQQTETGTALALVAALTAGVILASDVFHSTAGVDTLLFGSLLTVGTADIAVAAIAALVSLAAVVVFGPRWLAAGFDPAEQRSAVAGAVLLGSVAFAVLATIAAVGALLATALLVIPAATARLLTTRLWSWQLLSVAIAAVEGVVGLLISVELNAPPGAAIGVLSGAVFAVVAVARAVRGPSRLGVAAVAAALLVAGCGEDSGGSADRPVVIATTTQLADITRSIAGDSVEVVQILEPNSDPHDYEPRPDDVRATAEAEAVLRSGGHLDEWMDEIVATSGSSAPTVIVGDSVPTHLPAGEEEYDPHWWHDPRNVAAAVATIGDALTDAAPDQRDALAEGADRYLQRVRALDTGIEQCIETLPVDDRKLVTDHDAFGYFAGRYGLKVVGAVIPAQTTQAQPSAGELSDLARVIEREGVDAVFPEESVNADLADAIAEQTGASAQYTLYGDALGPEGSDGATYLGMERHNADAIVRGLSKGRQGCEVAGL